MGVLVVFVVSMATLAWNEELADAAQAAHLYVPRRPKPYEFIGFGDIHGPKPFKFIGFGDIHGPKPYKFVLDAACLLAPDLRWPPVERLRE